MYRPPSVSEEEQREWEEAMRLEEGQREWEEGQREWEEAMKLEEAMKHAEEEMRIEEEEMRIEEARKHAEEEMRFEEPQRKIKELEWRNMELEQKNAELRKKMRDQANKLSSSTDKFKGSQRKLKKLEQRNIKLEEKLQEKDNELEHAAELDRYEIKEGRRGICLIINNVNFLSGNERRGSEIDEKKISILFGEELHFIVETKRNLGGLEILKTAQEIAAIDHSKYTAFALIIMSHGKQKDVIYGVDGRKAGVEDIMSEFTATKCPTLGNKPKLFFIQACRGQASDRRMSRLAPADNIEGDSIAVTLSADSNLPNGVSPQEADFLLAFATVPGYKAWRSKVKGSWFIKVLVDVIRKYHSHHHLLDMMTEVNKQVADIANDNPDVDLSFQVPAPAHTLRAQVFL